MVEDNWNLWKLTALAMALLMVTALITGLVVANWSGPETNRRLGLAGPRAGTGASSLTRPVAQPAVPPQVIIQACNDYAAQQAGPRDQTLEVVKDAALGAVVGAAVGAAGGAIVEGGRGAGKGAAIGGVVGVGAGTLYGLNEHRKTDERYRDAYGACMRARGYTG